MPEKLIAALCSPTLRGVKSASLVNCEYETKEKLLKEVTQMSMRLGKKGIYCMVLGYPSDHHALIYFFRPDKLQKDLRNPGTKELMKSLGYESDRMGACLNQLRKKLENRNEFPHEIGCFLGYPYEDVRGFMNHEKCAYCGMWQVYSNVEETKKLFDLYDSCTRECIHEFECGIPLEQLAVA